MNTVSLLWVTGLIALLALAGGVAAWHWEMRRTARANALPSEWHLVSRRVFSNGERQLYRALHDALPQHLLLAKLPLVRLCRPTDPDRQRYWYGLLGTAHVSFAICSAGGRVLAAIDIDSHRPARRRALQIKQSVLAACDIAYLRCSADDLPSALVLQNLVRGRARAAGPAAAPEAKTPDLDQARDTLSNTVATRRAERTARWHDSAVFQDSFFAPDNRVDAFAPSDFMPASDPPPAAGNVISDAVEPPASTGRERSGR